MAAKPCDLWCHMCDPFVPSRKGGHTCKVSPQSVQPLRRRRFLKVKNIYIYIYGCRITWLMMSSMSFYFFLWIILSQDDPQKFSYRQMWCSTYAIMTSNEGTHDIIKKKKKITFPMRSTCDVPSFNFFFGAVSEIQRSKVFPFSKYGCHTTWPMTS